MSAVQNRDQERPPLKVSAIIPYYRHGASIERAVASAWQQTTRPDEIIVVNDGSSADAFPALKHLANSYPADVLRIIHMSTNQGPGRARNVGWQSAKGEYLAFLDADDVWHPQKIELQLDLFRRHPEADLICSESLFIDSLSSIDQDLKPCRFYALRPIDLLVHNPVSTRTVILRRSIDLRFAEHKKNSEDYQLYLTAVLRGLKLYYVEADLAFCFKSEFGDNGLSAQLESAHRGHVDTLRQIRQQGLVSPPLYFVLRMFAQLKHCRRHLFLTLGLNKMKRPLGLAAKRYIPYFRFKSLGTNRIDLQ
jgi:glycosyltransferase involved in cell wall biosynthesis